MVAVGVLPHYFGAVNINKSREKHGPFSRNKILIWQADLSIY